MNQRKHKRAKAAGYAMHFVRLIELENEAPLLAGSVDEFQGTTDPNNSGQGGGITVEDFDNGGNITFP